LNKRNRSLERKNSRLNSPSRRPKGKFGASFLNRIFYDVEALSAKQEEIGIGWIKKRKIRKVYKIPIGLPLKEVKEGSRSNSVARDRAKHSELGMGFLSLPESPAGLLGLGSLSWAGHQVHLSLPINQFLNAGVDPKEIPLPHESRSFGSTLSQFAEGFHGQNMRNSWRFRSCNWGSVAD